MSEQYGTAPPGSAGWPPPQRAPAAPAPWSQPAAPPPAAPQQAPPAGQPPWAGTGTGYGQPPGAAPGWGGGPGAPMPPGGPGPYGRPPMGPPPMAYGGDAPAVNKPGVGVVIGLLGVAMFFLALVALPWVDTPADDDPKLDDFSDMPEDVAEQSDSEVIAAYADGLWIVVVVGLAIAVVTSTLAVPQSQGGRVALGFVTAGLLGLLHLADRRGTWAHRVCGAAATFVYGLLHVGAVVDVFTVEGESADLDPGVGIWVGVLSLVVVLAGCIVGTRTERTAPAYGGYGYR